MSETSECSKAEGLIETQAGKELPTVSQVNSAHVFFSGAGEMPSLMRQTDWAATPFGAVSEWPQSLITAAGICLSSRFPMVLWWGPELCLIYNDAWRPSLGTLKHPALGKPGKVVWAEIWHIIGPMLEGVLLSGEATWSTDMLLPYDRYGYLEETYWTYSYSPIREESGTVSGVFTAVQETTQRYIGERRLRTLRDLGAEVAAAQSVEQACRNAATIYDHNPADLPFTLVYLVDAQNTHARLMASGSIPSGSPLGPPTVSLDTEDTCPWPIREVWTTGRHVVVEDLPNRVGSCPRGVWMTDPAQAVVLPLRRAGQQTLAGVLVAGVNPGRRLDDEYQSFLGLVAEHTATAIANARVLEEERTRSEALAELDRVKTAFFSNVSHELRTPLTLMLGPLEELKAQFGRSTSSLDVMQYQQIVVVHRNGLRLLKLVNTLLDFSRIEAGRAQAAYEETDLASFTADLASVFRSAIEKADLSLIIDCQPLPEPVFLDRDMWEKIVLNLLSNAFKFTLNGEIEVSLKTDPSSLPTRQVILTVRDTGVGIPADELPRMFERFYRVAGSQGRTYEGTGIGLSLVQELARLHGGSVSVESVYGKGSTFRVFIPLGKSHLPHTQVGPARVKTSTARGAKPFVEEVARWLPEDRTELSESDGATLSLQPPVFDTEVCRPRILLADDNADMRDYVRRLLSSRGYNVETVGDGQAALDRAQANLPDLVLTDVMMPRLDGFGLLKAIRADERTRTLPVILLSARAGEEARVEGLERGADDYLVKPFSARELLARVDAHVELARLRKEAAGAQRLLQDELQLILDSAPSMIWYKDTRNHILRANKAAADSIGLPKDRIEGRAVADFYPQEADRYYQDDLIVIRTGQPRLGIVEPYRLPTGERRWIQTDKVPMKDEAGHVVGILVLAQDITERKQAEAALNESEELYRATFANAAIGIAHVGLDGRWLRFNDAVCTITGYSREELRHMNFADVTHPEDLDADWSQARRVLAGEIPTYSMEKRYYRKDGSLIWINLTVSLLRDEDHRPLHFISIIKDIDDRKRGEEALREAQARVQHWNVELEQAVTMKTAELQRSQERLRTMATELNLAEQRERKRLATELHDHLQQILVLGKLKLGQGQRLAKAVPAAATLMKETDDVLSEALQYTRTLVSALSPTVLRDHGLAAALEWLGTSMQKHDLDVIVTVPDDPVTLPEDQMILLFQFVRELLINSAKHAASAHATVRMEQDHGRLRIEVRDEGAGFDLAAVAAADSPTGGISSKFGLFSIRERMRALGGSFDIQSAPGQGTTATLTLPVGTRTEDLGLRAEFAEKPVGRQPSLISSLSDHSVLTVPSSARQKNVPVRVLLVDDHAMVRQGIRAMLESYQDVHVVGEAVNGQEAVRLTEELRPGIVLMDINMPKMNGIEATGQITSRYPATVVIGLSVNTESENQEAMKRAGAVRLMTKEAAVGQLYDAIQEEMRKRES